MKAFAFSIITNKCVTEYESQDEPGHANIVEIGQKQQFVLAGFVSRLITQIDAE